MLNKIYETIKKTLKDNYKEIILFIITIFIATYQLPFYIDAPGGLIDASKRVSIKDAPTKKGSFNMAYVSEIPATLPLLLVAQFNKKWDILKKEEVILENETKAEAEERGKIYLQTTAANAVLYAYTRAGKEVSVKNNRILLLYKFPEADTDLIIGDSITKINHIPVANVTDVGKVLETCNANSRIIIEVVRKNKTYTRYAKLDKDKKIGVILQPAFDIKSNPDCKFNFDSKESGPSGGLITTLTIYNYLVKEDITNGLKIAGTGTIEPDGSVGEIGGIKYKLAGVVKKKADLFFCPAGENYNEAMKEKKKNKYKIKIIGVETLDEALNYLKNYKKKD
ncbi:MAG: S16 family serine protease [Bacilli bacterium]